MFIIKLGAEALSLKSGSMENTEGNSFASNNSLSPNSSNTDSIFDKDTNLLKSLLNGCLVESALLIQDNSKVKRCQSACCQNNKNEMFNNFHRPRSDTAPQSGVYISNQKFSENNYTNRKRKIHQICENNISERKSILYQSLTKDSKQSDTMSHIISTNYNNSSIVQNGLINCRIQNLMNTDLVNLSNNNEKLNVNQLSGVSQSTISTDETKRLRQQINSLLKKIMQIIKYYSNYSSSSELCRLHFVSELWHKILVLIIVQMESENCKILFRWLLLSVFNGKDEIGCSRRDQILLMEKLQEFVRSYIWLKSNSEMVHCILFWFMAKYGYPDVFFMSQEVIICKLKNLPVDKIQKESIFKLIQDLSELSENHMRHLFCQHLPSDCSMAEFLVQWT